MNINTEGVTKSRKSQCRGTWSEGEDEALVQAVERYGAKNWKRIAECVPGRSDVQCLHRWQKVLNPELIKGPWTDEEDQKVRELVIIHGPKKWSLIASHLPGRIGKQCRERWTNHLDPAIKKGNWEVWEDDLIIKLQREIGNKWARIAQHLPGRTDNAIKNRFNSTISRKIRQKQTKTSQTYSKKPKGTNKGTTQDEDGTATSDEDECDLGSNEEEEREICDDEPGLSESDTEIPDPGDTRDAVLATVAFVETPVGDVTVPLSTMTVNEISVTVENKSGLLSPFSVPGVSNPVIIRSTLTPNTTYQVPKKDSEYYSQPYTYTPPSTPPPSTPPMLHFSPNPLSPVTVAFAAPTNRPSPPSILKKRKSPGFSSSMEKKTRHELQPRVEILTNARRQLNLSSEDLNYPGLNLDYGNFFFMSKTSISPITTMNLSNLEHVHLPDKGIMTLQILQQNGSKISHLCARAKGILDKKPVKGGSNYPITRKSCEMQSEKFMADIQSNAIQT